MTYEEFLLSKVPEAVKYGMHVTDSDVHPLLKPHQRDIVRWAVMGGRRAIFASFGLGKTMMQLEALRLIKREKGGKALVVCPLGVRQEFKIDAAKLGISVEYVRTDAEVEAATADILLTNYERVRDGAINPGNFMAVSLDEASVLRGYGTKTYQEFLTLFPTVPYKFVCTATPSPNRFKELIHYAGFLGVMDTGEALTRFFQRDPEKAGNLQLYPHKEREFWLWMTTWAIFLTKPSDLGYSDEGYDLPEFKVEFHMVPASGATQNDDTLLQEMESAGLEEASLEKRESIGTRLNECMEILLSYRNADKKTVPGVVRQESGRASAEAACEESRTLSEEQRILQAQSLKMEAGEPGKDGGTRSIGPAEEPGDAQSAIKGVLQGKQGEAPKTGAGSEIPEYGGHSGRCGNAEGEAGQQVHDLRDSGTESCSGAPGSGPQPQNRTGEGTIVPSLQRRSRCVYGVPDTPANRGKFLGKQCVIWVTLNSEQRAVEKALKDNGISWTSIDGSTDIDEREDALGAWKNGLTQALVAKPVILGSGANLQQANRMLFLGIDYKANDFMQSLHRCHRFGQLRPVTAHVIYTEAEQGILDTLLEKWENHKRLVQNMTDIIKQYGLAKEAISTELSRSMGCPRQEVQGAKYVAVNNDCVHETKHMPDNCVDLIHTSIPFGNHYEYSPSYNDFGHNTGNDSFFQQMDHLTPELLRILRPGRVAAVHVKDRIQFGNVTGYGMPSVDPFHALTISHYMKHGFIFFGMVTIETDVVRENNQTYRLGWTEQCKDGTKMGVGCPEYLLLFRKLPSDTSKAYADMPVTKSKEVYTRGQWQIDARAKWNSSGDRLLSSEELANMDLSTIGARFKDYFREHVYSYTEHVNLANELDKLGKLPATFEALQVPARDQERVWSDVSRMRTLNSEQSRRNLQNHICPLQFDIVDRVINRYTNPGEVVFDPFGGIMTVPYRAVTLGRIGYGCELNPSYWRDGIEYLQRAEREKLLPTLSLFDDLDA